MATINAGERRIWQTESMSTEALSVGIVKISMSSLTLRKRHGPSEVGQRSGIREATAPETRIWPPEAAAAIRAAVFTVAP